MAEDVDDGPQPIPFRPKGLQAPAGSQASSAAPAGRFKLPNLPHMTNPFEGAKPLTIVEANKLRPILRAALEESCRYADEGISMTNRKHQECTIWSGPMGLDAEELDALTDIMIERASLNGVAAQVVRGIVNLYQEAQIILILGPRFLRTYQFYRLSGGFVLPI